MVQPSSQIVIRETGEIVAPSSNLPSINPESIRETKQAIALLQSLVKDMLTRDIDYGRIPGTPQESLWDPGAQMVISAFNCYPGERRMLTWEDTNEKIVACIEVPLISRATQRVMATGVGAASTLETKHKYRWVEDPAEAGYDEEAIKTLKTKTSSRGTLYRIENPEHSDLVNTILKMASKRAEVDAAQSLPGVASVLRKMFTGYKEKAEKGTGEDKWNWFWGEVRMAGYTQEQAHQRLGVPSIKDWLSTGQTLEQALDVLRKRPEQKAELKAEQKAPPPQPPIAQSPPPVELDKRHKLWQAIQEQMQMKPKVVPDSIKGWFAKNYQIDMDPAFLAVEEPWIDLTDVMLESFLNTLILFHESSKKKAAPAKSEGG